MAVGLFARAHLEVGVAEGLLRTRSFGGRPPDAQCEVIIDKILFLKICLVSKKNHVVKHLNEYY